MKNPNQTERPSWFDACRSASQQIIVWFKHAEEAEQCEVELCDKVERPEGFMWGNLLWLFFHTYVDGNTLISEMMTHNLERCSHNQQYRGSDTSSVLQPSLISLQMLQDWERATKEKTHVVWSLRPIYFVAVAFWEDSKHLRGVLPAPAYEGGAQWDHERDRESSFVVWSRRRVTWKRELKNGSATHTWSTYSLWERSHLYGYSLEPFDSIRGANYWRVFYSQKAIHCACYRAPEAAACSPSTHKLSAISNVGANCKSQSLQMLQADSGARSKCSRELQLFILGSWQWGKVSELGRA